MVLYDYGNMDGRDKLERHREDKKYTIGDQLARGRKQKEWSVQDVAEKICISRARITAVETTHITELPRNIYTIGLLRSYAKVVDLDPDNIVAQYKRQIGYDPKDSLDNHIFLRQEKSRKLVKVILGILLLSAVFAGGTYGLQYWQKTHNTKHKITESVKKTNSLRAAEAHASNKNVAKTGAVLSKRDAVTTPIASALEKVTHPSTTAGHRPNDGNAKILAKTKSLVTEKSKAVRKNAAKAKSRPRTAGVIAPANKATTSGNTAIHKKKRALVIHKAVLKKPVPIVSRYILVTAVQTVYIRVKTKSGQSLFDGFLERGKTAQFPLDKGYYISAGDGSLITFSIEKFMKNVVLGKKGTVMNVLPLQFDTIKKMVRQDNRWPQK